MGVAVGFFAILKSPAPDSQTTKVVGVVDSAAERASGENNSRPPTESAELGAESTSKVIEKSEERRATDDIASISVASEAAGATSDPDPESQPRGYHRTSFLDPEALPAGIRMKGVELTPRGLELSPESLGGDDMAVGSLESPPQTLEFGSNGVTPLWKADLPDPDATGVMVELSFSANGTDWSEWFPFETEQHSRDQIAATYPDGRPNPNYGYLSGGLLFFGMDQYEHFRYRLTLFSTTSASPIVSDFNIFHQDSTLGRGRPARRNPAIRQGD